MKAFIALCFLAVAFAEPEADPALLYKTYGSYFPYSVAHPYTAYAANTYAHVPLTYNTWAYPTTYAHGLYKREAEAEADPLFYYNTYAHTYAHPTVYSTSYAHRPVTYATTPYAYKAYVPATHVTQTNGAVSSTAGINSGYRNPFVGGYANAGNYVANSAGVVHVAKREAEAEADPYLLYNKFYSPSVYPTGYHYAPSVYRTGYTTYPTYTGYTGYNGYRYLY